MQQYPANCLLLIRRLSGQVVFRKRLWTLFSQLGEKERIDATTHICNCGYFSVMDGIAVPFNQHRWNGWGGGGGGTDLFKEGKGYSSLNLVRSAVVAITDWSLIDGNSSVCV